MSIDFSKLTNLNYLTEQPPTTMAYFWPLVAGLTITLIVGLFCWRTARRPMAENHPRRTIFVLLARWLSISPTIGLILLFFRNQGIMYLSWRFWSVMLALVWLGGMIWMAYYILIKYPQAKKKHELRELKNKYIPEPRSTK